MKKIGALTFVLAFLLLTLGAQTVDVANANPVKVYTVPDIWIGYPSSIGGYVNSTVEFEVYVYMPLDSATINSISYSVDGQQAMTVGDLKVAIINDLVYVDRSTEKIDFKKYTGNIILKNLSEGNHKVTASVNGMSNSQSFIVNSHYVIAELTMLSPVTQVYWEPIPLTFKTNGEISDAHYYISENKKLVSENTINGNTTLDRLPVGDYELLLFVTTQHGQTLKTIQFSVSNSNPMENLSLIAGITVPLAFVVVGGIVFVKKRRKQPNYIGVFSSLNISFFARQIGHTFGGFSL